MFFYISKILSFIISPLVWVFVLLILALIFLKNKPRAKKLLIVAIAIFWFFGNGYIANVALGMWEVPIATTSELAPHYDVGIVLGGGMVGWDATKKRIQFRDNVDRILQAVQLYKDHRIAKMLISSGAGNLQYPEVLESAILKRYLVGIGIPGQDILIDSLSNNTRENAVNSAQILKQFYPQGKFLLITSSLHIHRAKACFDKVGIATDIYPTNKISGKITSFQLETLLMPALSSFICWELFLHEVVGYLTYKMAGYI